MWTAPYSPLLFNNPPEPEVVNYTVNATATAVETAVQYTNISGAMGDMYDITVVASQAIPLMITLAIISTSIGIMFKLFMSAGRASRSAGEILDAVREEEDAHSAVPGEFVLGKQNPDGTINLVHRKNAGKVGAEEQSGTAEVSEKKKQRGAYLEWRGDQ